MRFFLLLLFFCAPFCLSGATSGPFIQISATGGNSAPALAVAANGNAFAAWLNFPNNIQAAFFNASINPPTGQWTFLGTLAVGSVPSIGIDQVGNAFITYVSTANGPSTQILVRRFDATTMTFTPPLTVQGQQISITGTQNFAPKIAVSGIGVALVIWMQNIPFQILSSSYTPMTGLWSAPTPILSNIYPATFALDNFNRGIAIIDNFSGQPQGVIQAARLFVP